MATEPSGRVMVNTAVSLRPGSPASVKRNVMPAPATPLSVPVPWARIESKPARGLPSVLGLLGSSVKQISRVE